MPEYFHTTFKDKLCTSIEKQKKVPSDKVGGFLKDFIYRCARKGGGELENLFRPGDLPFCNELMAVCSSVTETGDPKSYK